MIEFNLALFRPGDVIAVRNEGGLFGNNIQRRQLKEGFLLEDARFTHVEIIIIRDNKNPDKYWSIRVAPPKAKLVNFPVFYKGKYIKIVRYKNYDNFSKLKDVSTWSATHVNVPYDFPGILKFIFVWIKQRTSMWFCSENATWSFQQVYLDSLDGLKPSKSMPAHLLDPEFFEVVWEGKIPG